MARDLIDEVITLIHAEANNNPAPKLCKIVGNYEDGTYCDVEVEDLGRLNYIKTIGSTDIGLEGVICFLNGKINNTVVITPATNEIIIDSINLDNFYVDFTVKFGVSGRDDIISIESTLKQKLEE